jgi:hypothetical protein
MRSHFAQDLRSSRIDVRDRLGAATSFRSRNGDASRSIVSKRAGTQEDDGGANAVAALKGTGKDAGKSSPAMRSLLFANCPSPWRGRPSPDGGTLRHSFATPSGLSQSRPAYRSVSSLGASPDVPARDTVIVNRGSSVGGLLLQWRGYKVEAPRRMTD